MSQLSPTDAVRVLREALASLADEDYVTLWSVASRLRRDAPDYESIPWPLVWGLEYRRHDPDTEEFDLYGTFGPVVETAEHIEPPPVAEVGDDTAEVWLAIAESDLPAFTRARFADLVWERRFGDQPPRRLIVRFCSTSRRSPNRAGAR